MWKRKAAAALALVMVMQSALPAFAAGGTKEDSLRASVKAEETAESARKKENINKEWQFKYYGSDTGTPTAETFDDSDWDTVNVPHTWNNLDGQDGGNDMARGNGWYRKKLEWKSEYAGKQIFLEFLGASRDVTVYVNGTQVGDMHRGAYTAFRYDITDELKNGANVIAVKTDNTFNTSVIPLSGDFNVYGGIYRDVSLVIADPVHVDLEDYGSNGLYLQTGNVSEESGELTVRSTIVNDGTKNSQVTVKAVVKEGVDSFEEIDEVLDPLFDAEDMLVKEEAPVETLTDTFTLAPGAEKEFSKSVTVSNPHLWNGLTDPFRYQVDLTVEVDGKVVDNVSDYVGFRDFSVDINNGFYLNGVSYPLRGVSRHQDWEDMGCAISTAEHDVDFGMIYEIGANTIRLAHYPHDPYFYDLCDRYGMVVWAEIPFVDQVGTAEDFYDITERQLIELIRQQYNRPGICFWGLQNEVGNSGNPGGNNSAGMDQIMVKLNEKAHAEDTTGRLTTQATNGNAGWVSDLLAWNTYPGWYNGNLNGFGGNIDGKKSSSRPVGISEYGFGGNVEQHEIPANKPASTTGQWHPEEYQSLGHEKAVEVFDSRPWVWGTYVWCMFDFACDKRAEGDNPGINDKGIVTYDRKIKKDSFYIYKANWNQRDKFAHITSSRIDTNDTSSIPFVKVYSNCASVELLVDGVSKGQMTKEGYGIFKLNEELDVRENMVLEAVATDEDGNTYKDTAVLKRKLGTVAELQSDVLVVNNEKKTIGLTGNIDVSDLADILTGVRGATYYVTNENDEQVTAGNVTFGMKAVVTSEDEEVTETYTFVSVYLSAGKKVTASSEQTENEKGFAVDGNSATRWAAATGGGNQWIYVDLEEEYFLSKIRIDWFNTEANKRSYQYTIEVSDDAINWRDSGIDRAENREQDSVTDTFPDGTTGRYVRISVAGIRNSSGNSVTNINASIYEIAINGWNIASTAYDIDHTEKVIRIPDNVPMVGGNFPDYAFMEGLELKGNYTYKLDMNSYFITGNGDSLTIIDEAGKKTVYGIYFATGSPGIVEIIDVTGITLSDSSCSMETGQTKQIGLTLTPANATRRAVLWSSSNPDAVTVSRNGKLTAVGEGEAVITATNAYSGAVSNELKVRVTLSEGYILKGVLADAEAVLEQLHVTNDTTDEDIMEAVRKAVTIEGITAQWKKDFQKAESTETEQGSITGQIRLELGKSFVTLNINKTISSGEEVQAILGEEKSKVQTAIEKISVTNDVTKEEILTAAAGAVTNEDVTAEWIEFHKTEASQTQDGSIEGKLQLTLDGQTMVLEINWTIAKTGGSQTEQPPEEKPGQQEPGQQQPGQQQPGQQQPGQQNGIEEGKAYDNGKYTYKVTSISKKTAEVVGVKDKKLTKITVYDTVNLGGTDYKITSVAAFAFKNNKAVTGVIVGKNVEKIGNSAFAGCVKLKKATVRSTKLNEIGNKAFYRCKALKNIILKSKSLKKVGKNAFQGVYKKAVIKVPKAKYKAYVKLLGKKGQSKTVKIKK